MLAGRFLLRKVGSITESNQYSVSERVLALEIAAIQECQRSDLATLTQSISYDMTLAANQFDDLAKKSVLWNPEIEVMIVHAHKEPALPECQKTAGQN